MFCIMEKDEKTYDYVQRVITHLRRDNVGGLVQLDNLLQTGEIQNHLQLNRLPVDNADETLAWIETNAQGFRDYLNTIKVVAVTWVCAEETKDLTWNDFCRIAERINSLKPCLDAIHH